jgi:hypothetical protein
MHNGLSRMESGIFASFNLNKLKVLPAPGKQIEGEKKFGLKN